MSQMDVLARPFPRGALLAAGALVGLSLAAAAVGRLTDIGTTHMPAGTVVESHDLSFADRPDGAVVVFDHALGREIYRLPPETNGFVRGVLRGLVRERRIDGMGPQQPFRMNRWGDGRLTIEDPETGTWVDVGAFGPTNADAFLRIFESDGGTR